jgi:hypothetical protein
MYEALKKAEIERKRAAGLEVKSPQAGNPAVDEGMSDSTKTTILLIAIVIVFGIAIFRLFGDKITLMFKKPVVQAAAVTPPAHVPVPVAAAAPLANAQRLPGTYGLDGVIDAGANSMAIVNGKLLKVDDAIDDLILKKISPKEVELLNSKDNTTVTLKIQ